jgi:hypothetical protein
MDEHESAIVAQTTITFPLLDDKDPVLQQAVYFTYARDLPRTWRRF